MKTKTLIRAAGILCLCIFLLHIIGGQMTLVEPLMDSNLIDQEKVEWLGAWHMISVLLMFVTIKLFQQANKMVQNIELLRFIEILCYLFAGAFVGASLWMQKFAPQWTLFLVLGLLIHYSVKKIKKES